MIRYGKILFVVSLMFLLFGCAYEIDENYKEYSILEGEELYKGIAYTVSSRMDFEGEDIFLDYKEDSSGSNKEITILNAPMFSNESSNKRDSVLKDSSKYFKESFKIDKELDYLVINWNITYRDNYGNSQIKKVLSIGLKRSTYDKINWDHFKVTNYENISDLYDEDSKFKADELEKEYISKLDDVKRAEKRAEEIKKEKEKSSKDKKEDVKCEDKKK